MSGSKRGLHEFRGSVNHSGQDTTYSTGLRPLLAKSCGQANVSVLLLTLLPQTLLQASPRRKTIDSQAILDGHSDIPVFCYTSLIKNIALQFCPKSILRSTRLHKSKPFWLCPATEEGLLSLPQFHPPVPGRDVIISAPAFPWYCRPCCRLSAQGTSCSLCMIRQAMFQAGLHQKDTVLAVRVGSQGSGLPMTTIYFLCSCCTKVSSN